MRSLQLDHGERFGSAVLIDGTVLKGVQTTRSTGYDTRIFISGIDERSREVVAPIDSVVKLVR